MRGTYSGGLPRTVVGWAIVAALGAGYGIGYFAVRGGDDSRGSRTEATVGAEGRDRPTVAPVRTRTGMARGYIRTISVETRCIEVVRTAAEATATSPPAFHVLAFFTPEQWQTAMKQIRSSREGWRCTVSDMSMIAHEYVVRIGGTVTSAGESETVLSNCWLQEILDREPSRASTERMAAEHQPKTVDEHATPVRDDLYAWITERRRQVLIDPARAQVTPAGYGYVYVKGKVQNRSASRYVRNVTVTWCTNGARARVVPSTLAPRQVGSYEATIIFPTRAEFEQFDLSNLKMHPEATGQWERGVFEQERPRGLPLW